MLSDRRIAFTAMKAATLTTFLGLVVLLLVDAVDRSKFRTCQQTLFCATFRNREALDLYQVNKTSIQFLKDQITWKFMTAPNEKEGEGLQGHLSFYDSGNVRFKVDEINPLHGPRWQPNEDIFQEDQMILTTYAHSKLSDDEIKMQITSKNGQKVSVILHLNPFFIDVFNNNDQLIMKINKRNRIHFQQHMRPREEAKDHEDGANAAKEDIHRGKKIVDYGEDGLAIYEDGSVQEKGSETAASSTERRLEKKIDSWEETFGTHVDTKPYGPASVGIDIDFDASHVYGIPEHASDHSLKTTTGLAAEYSEPFRLYNLDVFEFELDVPMALYGSIPVMLAHDTEKTSGIFWNNPSETWIDISKSELGKKETHWMSESGLIDIFVLPGPTALDVFKQYSTITGTNALPPIFSLGYHQCRWNYKNENDVEKVNAGFEEHAIPYDVIWLDIEHTDGKKYFTWDSTAFPTPLKMQEKISSYGRKMVTIVDPHIKRDVSFHVHKEATSKGMYIKNKDGADFDGWCWPGSSSYVDFTSAQARSWWSHLFQLNQYQGSSLDLYTWNDMNEPSVFNGPEVSMSKDCKNINGVEHREWHNLYGLYMQWATAAGQTLRHDPPHNVRPFVLSRAFAAGSQRHGAVWTGDNAADWRHLAFGTKMLLSMGVAGLPFVGADVGGFFGNPDAELTTRWYQTAAYQPFFRGHAHHDSKRREPWVFGEPHTKRIRKAIADRYVILPYIYTLFFEAYQNGVPVMRPLWVHYPKDEKVFAMDDQFLLGADLLVRPIVAAGVERTEVYLPTKSVWYDIETHAKFMGGMTHSVAAPMDVTPVFQRGGSIIPKKMRLRRSSKQMYADPYTLFVALNEANIASGHLYMDDETSFDFKMGKYQLRKLHFENFVLTNTAASTHVSFRAENMVERIVIAGFHATPLKVSVVKADPRDLDAMGVLTFTYDSAQQVLTVRKPKLHIGLDWAIEIQV